MNKQELIRKIKEIEALTNEEKSELIELVNTQKRYGLVWEEKPEEVEEELREKLPVLVEVKERAILAEELPEEPSEDKDAELFENEEEIEKPKAPNHILIEGDNLHALTVLNYTHAGQIDAMYFDPPYNTGNKDFKYNDKFVDREDAYRHSKWLSFMHKRLKLSRNLLKDSGVIFISIDENEASQLKLLCDEIFGENNLISMVANINNPKGRSDDKYVARAHEYLLIYKKNEIKMDGWEAPDKVTRRYNKIDKQGIRYREIDLRKTGENDRREDRPNLFYYFYYNQTTKELFPSKDDIEKAGFIQIKPTKQDESDGNWRWELKTAEKNMEFLIPKFMPVRQKWTIVEKDILNENDKIKPTTVWDFKDVNSERGSEQFINLGFKKEQFPKPKPLGLIIRALKLIPSKDFIILDIFAGSGTTLHSTILLNEEDNGSRQCILVTNNENKIAEEICFERNLRVIKGYTTPKGEKIEGLRNNNFRYFKTDFVGREKTNKNRKKLTELATDMLCIKEDCYNSITNDKLQITKGKIKLFENDNIFMMIILEEDFIEKAVEIIQTLNKKVKVYIFSPGQYPFTDDFEDVIEKVELCALPEAIYKAYKAILPKKKVKDDESTVELLEEGE